MKTGKGKTIENKTITSVAAEVPVTKVSKVKKPLLKKISTIDKEALEQLSNIKDLTDKHVEKEQFEKVVDEKDSCIDLMLRRIDLESKSEAVQEMREFGDSTETSADTMNSTNSRDSLERDSKPETSVKATSCDNNENSPFSKKWERKERCNVKEILNNYGNIFILDNPNKSLLACKIRMINFPIKKELFDKGKELDLENFNKYRKENNLPDIKFWNQRYYYFTKFNDGITMDYESWYSVTPEELALYTAKLAGPNAVIVDAFCGPGGNVIQFSKHCKYVYAVDIDPVKIKICQNNCKVYKCSDNVKFILSDFMKMEGKIKADYIFLSPPWGGVTYKDSEYYSIKNMIKNPNIYEIIRVCLSIADKIQFYLPRTLILEEFYEIIEEILLEKNGGEYKDIFIDIHILNSANKIKAILLIFGTDIRKLTIGDVKKYLATTYNVNKEDEEVELLIDISKLIGISKFLKEESLYKRNIIKEERVDNLRTSMLIKHLKEKILTREQREAIEKIEESFR